jgi:hypothetical protein
MPVFTRPPSADELPSAETAADKHRKPEDPDDSVAESIADSWSYELLTLIGLGVLAILASRLRKRRRSRRWRRRRSSSSSSAWVRMSSACPSMRWKK